MDMEITVDLAAFNRVPRYGVELSPNKSFVDLTGLVANVATLLPVAGGLQATLLGAAGGCYIDVPTVAGMAYVLTANASVGTASQAAISIYPTAAITTPLMQFVTVSANPQATTLDFVAQSGTTRIYLSGTGSTLQTVLFNNLSIKAVTA